MTDEMESKPNGLPDQFQRAFTLLESEGSVAGLLDLYDRGIITALEVMNYVWELFHDKDDARELVCEQLRAHQMNRSSDFPHY